jgi:hypothetical protein
MILLLCGTGVNPKSLSGSNTGVFVTAALNELDEDYVLQKINPYTMEFLG